MEYTQILIKPANNVLNYTYNNHKINFSKVNEICQGGPEIGNLYIDENLVTYNNKIINFGTNIVFFDNSIVLPIYKISRFGWGIFSSGVFKLAIINLSQLDIEIIGNSLDLIMPFKINNTTIFYYTDLQNRRLNKITYLRKDQIKK